MALSIGGKSLQPCDEEVECQKMSSSIFTPIREWGVGGLKMVCAIIVYSSCAQFMISIKWDQQVHSNLKKLGAKLRWPSG
jgi:hypothetical protein